MSLGSEFKEFAMKGNVIDLAVGVVIGAAFGKIVASLVGDIVMPPLGRIIGNVNFTDLAVQIGHDPKGKDVLWQATAISFRRSSNSSSSRSCCSSLSRASTA